MLNGDIPSEGSAVYRKNSISLHLGFVGTIQAFKCSESKGAQLHLIQEFISGKFNRRACRVFFFLLSAFCARVVRHFVPVWIPRPKQIKFNLYAIACTCLLPRWGLISFQPDSNICIPSVYHEFTAFTNHIMMVYKPEYNKRRPRFCGVLCICI